MTPDEKVAYLKELREYDDGCLSCEDDDEENDGMDECFQCRALTPKEDLVIMPGTKHLRVCAACNVKLLRALLGASEVTSTLGEAEARLERSA